MKTAKRRVLSFVMAMLTVITTVFGHVDYSVMAATETVAAWSYSAAPENGLPVQATTGNGTLNIDGGVYGGYSSKSLKADNWTVGGGWIMNVNATGYEDLTFSAQMRASGTGPANWNLQYKLADATEWTTIDNSAVSVTNSSLTDTYSSFSLPDELDGQAFTLKVNLADDVSAKGGTIATGGAGNINHVSIVGTVVESGSTDDSGNTEGTENTENTESTENTENTETPEVTISTIATALAASEGSFTVKGVVTLVDGNNIYVQDETGAMCVRLASYSSEIALGDTIIGTGTRGSYNGLQQLTGSTFEKSEGYTLTAKESTIDALTTEDVAKYVTLKNLTVTTISGDNTTVSDGTNSINIYKAVTGDTTLAVGDVIDVNAAVGIYKTTLQLRNTVASEITVVSKAETDDTDTPDTTPIVEDGTYVIYNPAYGMALSSNKTGNYHAGVAMTLNANGKFDEAAETELWTVKNNDDGTVTITGSTGVLSMATSYTSTTVNEVNNTWTLEARENGTVYIKNVGRNTYLEWYDKYSNFSTYNKIYDDSIGLFEMQFVEVEEYLVPNGSYVIYNPAYGMALSSNKTGNYHAGVAMTLNENGTFDEVANTEIWTVKNNADGTVTITGSTGVLSMAASYTSTTVDEVNNTWTLEERENGTVYVKNVGRNTYLEWYDRYSNFSTYNKIYDDSIGLFEMQFIPAVATESDGKTPLEGSKVVLYNLSAQGVLAAQDDNEESPSINGVSAIVEDGKATASNGAVVFEVKKNGEYFQFFNETYGYLCSGGTGNNAYYSLEVSEEADWKLSELNDGFLLESRVAKYNDKYSQYLEYYAGAYKTYSYYNVTDDSIYEFYFYECTNENLTGGIVNEPAVVTGDLLPAYVGIEYSFDFEVDAPFGVKDLAVSLADEALEYTVNAGIYTVTIPVEKIAGEKLEVVVSGTDNKDVTFSNTVAIEVKDEPAISEVTPASGSETGDDKRPVISAMISNAGENPTVTMALNGEAVEATYADGKISYTAASDMEDGRQSVTVTVTRADGKSVSKTWSFTVGEAAYQLYFGQLHSHTTYSDGSGSLESALDYIVNLPESANVDFVAFTDHSNYFDDKNAANPEGALYDMSLASEDSQNTWASYKNTVAEFNASQSDVVAIAGFEMTWSGGPGHMNTFNTDGIVSRNNSTLNNKTSDAGMKAYYALLSQAEGADAVSQFNHPGSTFGTFSDFSYWDAVIDTRIRLVEVGNGEGAVGAGGYYPSYEYYTMALDKGWHVAPTNNQDNHKGKWGNANDARDVILTDDFTEEGIYQAMRDLRMYSTEDKNLELYYTVNGLQLGSNIEEVPETLDINVIVNDPDATDSISKVEVIVNSGKVAHTWDSQADLATGELSCTLTPDYSYYYIRVTEGDGDLAVTAPVWVGESLKLGISSVECGTSTPVTDEALTLTTTLFNSESSDATVKSLTYTVNGGEVIGADTTGYTVSASSTLPITFEYTPSAAKLTKITVTAIVEQEGIEYTFSMDIELDIQDATKLAYIGIDAAHYNEYVAGNYKDSMGNFGELAAGYSVRTVELATSEDLIAACSNEKYKALILTAPSRRLTAAHTDPRTYSADEINAIVEFNNNGGTVILAGWSDFYEEPSKTNNTSNVEFVHMAATQNAVLEALGSSLRISDDATYDDSYNGGQQYRLYFNTYGENFLTEGVEVDPENLHDRMYTEVFSHYGGASVYAVDENGNATSTLPATVSPVVFGHSTTYSVDADNDGLGATTVPKYTYAEGDDRLLAMAMEQLDGKGAIIVSGAAFMSNFEVQATIEDSGSEKNYSNYRICENLVQYVNPVTITTIAEVQAQTEVGYKYTIEGIVTSNASGYDKDTAFFDCIYVQDATGGVCCFPVAGNYKIGDKVRVTGTTEFYQGEMELQVTEIETIGTGSVEPTTVTAAQVNDGSVLGQLITVNGTITSFEEANGLIQTIMVKDAEGNTCRVFIDGYITTDEDVKNVAVGNKITVTGLASYDNTFNAPDGPFPRIRIRDREDVVCTVVSTPATPVTPVVPSLPEIEEEVEDVIEEVVETVVETVRPVIDRVVSFFESIFGTVTIEDEDTPLAVPTVKTEVKSEEGWKDVTAAVAEVVSAETADIIILELAKETTVVPNELFTAIEGQNVDVQFQLENGISWTINGTTVTGDVSNLNLEVAVDAGEIPEEAMNTVVAETTAEVVKLSLAYSGEFGCEAVMNIPVGEANVGKMANLYYFNPETSEMEFIASALVNKDGTADLPFTHASDYAIVINEVEMAEEVVENTEVADEETPLASEENNVVLPFVMVVIVLLAAIAGVVIVLQRKKALK